MKVKVLKASNVDELESFLTKTLDKATSVSQLEINVVGSTIFCVVVYESGA